MLIYAGAIAVLMLFAIVLTPRPTATTRRRSCACRQLLVALLMLITLVYVALDTDWVDRRARWLRGDGAVIGEALLDKYVLPFEIASVLLLMAMVGAIVIVRPEGAMEEADE